MCFIEESIVLQAGLAEFELEDSAEEIQSCCSGDTRHDRFADLLLVTRLFIPCVAMQYNPPSSYCIAWAFAACGLRHIVSPNCRLLPIEVE